MNWEHKEAFVGHHSSSWEANMGLLTSALPLQQYLSFDIS